MEIARSTHYCMVLTMPSEYHHTTDMILAAGLISGPIFLAQWINDVNPWLALIGGLMGLIIGGVRIYEIVRGVFSYVHDHKRKRAKTHRKV